MLLGGVERTALLPEPDHSILGVAGLGDAWRGRSGQGEAWLGTTRQGFLSLTLPLFPKGPSMKTSPNKLLKQLRAARDRMYVIDEHQRVATEKLDMIARAIDRERLLLTKMEAELVEQAEAKKEAVLA